MGKRRSFLIVAVMAVAVTFPSTQPSAAGQAGSNAQLPLPPRVSPPGSGIPDLNGVWDGPSILNNAIEYLGGLPPFTPLGLERWNNRVLGDDPTGFCQPTGPGRVWHSPFPFQIIQTPGMVTFLFEIHHTFHRVFTDGRKHPEPLDVTWWGSSIGRYEGNKLIVETVGISDRSWLFTAGLQHSDQLKLTWVFEKTAPDTIKFSETFDDPVYFTRPWSISYDFKPEQYDMMEMICTDNNRDVQHFITSEKSREQRQQ